MLKVRWVWWLIGRFITFHPKGRGFESHSSRHVGTLGKSFTHTNSDTVSMLRRERLWVVVDLKRRYRNSLNEWSSVKNFNTRQQLSGQGGCFILSGLKYPLSSLPDCSTLCQRPSGCSLHVWWISLEALLMLASSWNHLPLELRLQPSSAFAFHCFVNTWRPASFNDSASESLSDTL